MATQPTHAQPPTTTPPADEAVQGYGFATGLLPSFAVGALLTSPAVVVPPPPMGSENPPPPPHGPTGSENSPYHRR